MKLWKKLCACCKTHRHLIGVALSAVAGLALAVWFGYASLSKLEARAEYAIYNDDYSTLSAPLAQDTEIAQVFRVQTDGHIYGVRLKLQNGGAQQGVVTVRLYETAGGELVAQSDVQASTILNDDFTSFFFAQGIEAQAASIYRITISYTGTDGDNLALWKSAADKAGYTLRENGAFAAGTLALQIATQYVVPAVRTAYWLLACGLALLCAGLYWLVFCRRAKTETVFAVIALGIGFVFCLFTPQLAAPDEYVHYTTSYYYASGLLGKDRLDENGKLFVRACDAPDSAGLFVQSHAYDPFAYTELAEGLGKNTESSECTVPVNARLATSVFPLVYAPQTAGITLARFLGLGYGWTLILGRLMNLLVYVALGWTAIRLIPFGKSALLAVSVFPMSLQLAGSLSYDALVNGLCFIFIALCMKYTYADEAVGWKKMLWLGALGAALAPGKAVYLVLVMLCFLIPDNKYKSRLHARGSKLAVFGASFVAWFAYNAAGAMSVFRANPIVEAPIVQDAAQTAELVQTAATVVSEIAPNGDSRLFFTVGYIFSHLEQTAALVLNTIQQNMPLYLQGLIGGRLGEQIVTKVEINWILIIAILLCTLLCATRREDDAVYLKGGRRVWSLLIFLGVSALIVFACVTWTPANYTTIFGIQGRYFLPVLPLVLLSLRNNIFVLKKDIRRQLWFALGCLDILVLYDAFAIICTR